MKKIITMVGASLFENFFKHNKEKDLWNHYEALKEKREKDWKNEKPRIERLKNGIGKWIENIENVKEVSAEVKSVFKIKEELKDHLEIFLLCSDTILSKLAGEIIKEKALPSVDNSLKIGEIKTIYGLQIWDRTEFNKGMANLISEIYSIANEYWDDVAINITGGYKATIPFLTIIAQLNKCSLYYIFEETDALMEVPRIPFSTEWFDWNEIGKYEEFFEKLEKGITESSEYQSFINSEFYKKFSFLIWESKPLAELNPIGMILYKKYKEKVFEFYAPEDVMNQIKNDHRLLNLMQKQFSNKKQRDAKTEEKNGHKVYDAGNNQFRIFYREIDGKIYVYKAFNNHDNYDAYLKSTPFREDIVKREIMREYKLIKEV